ncbi:PREDICTED: uncharacterized protein LOC108360106 isoform X1 [Rhagoletis zephyria]|uniref:uncharacterized protein LOC108360106 isoform X1 n=1 Tax=Rhagoletis zephyria TaxID=28612 RepID=UPI000811492C|nr:PREDICTED: uncharacterized protein LOC108360106 isoform X1 [Rhagoletis zephyria]
MADDPIRSRLFQYRQDRSRFARIVYTLAFIFFAISVIQWIIMIAVDGLRDFIIDFYFISIIALLISMLMVTAFVFFENLRFSAPLNWIIAIIIVIMMTWGLSRAIVEPELLLFAVTVIVVLVLALVFILIGVFINHDFTLDVVIMFVAAVIFFITSVFLVMLQLLSGVKIAFYLYSLFIIITVLMFLMYHAQTINGYRYAEMRINDYLLAALIIYHDMVLLLIMSFYLIAKICALAGGTGLSLRGDSWYVFCIYVSVEMKPNLSDRLTTAAERLIQY